MMINAEEDCDMDSKMATTIKVKLPGKRSSVDGACERGRGVVGREGRAAVSRRAHCRTTTSYSNRASVTGLLPCYYITLIQST
jgi:hypothetical protein